MAKEEYGEALKTTMWKKKRDIILKRDKYTCTKCRSKKCLHVHHTYYLKDKMPWAVPDDCLVTLCEVCHEKEHIKNIFPRLLGELFLKRRRRG
jgi:5-methylcytosine-specific restriction endonuclease McrA